MQLKGFDEFSKKLKRISDNAQRLERSGPQSVPLTEILNPQFVSSHTRFADVDSLFKESGFKIDSQEDLKAIPDDEWDQFIRRETTFASWKEMLSVAGAQWAKKQLGF